MQALRAGRSAELTLLGEEHDHVDRDQRVASPTAGGRRAQRAHLGALARALRAAHADGRRRHAVRADRAPAGGAGDAGLARGVAVAGCHVTLSGAIARLRGAAARVGTLAAAEQLARFARACPRARARRPRARARDPGADHGRPARAGARAAARARSAAAPPTTSAAAGRPQLRGSRIAESSQDSSSSAAISVMLVERRREPFREGIRRLNRGERLAQKRLDVGSRFAHLYSPPPMVARRRAPCGWSRASAPAPRGSHAARPADARSAFPRPRPCRPRARRAAAARFTSALELLDGAVYEHLRGAVRAVQRARDLAVVHAEREAHDERLATVLWERFDGRQHAAQLFASLREVLGGVHRGQRGRVLERRRWPPRAIAVEVRGEVVRDPDQPGSQRAPVATRAGRARSAGRPAGRSAR